MSIVEILDRGHLEDVISSECKNKILALFFYSNNDNNSKNISNRIRESSLKYIKDTINFLFINSEINSELTKLFKVSISPYLVVVRNGYIIRHLTGFELQDFVFSLDDCSETLLTIKSGKNDIRQLKSRNNSITSNGSENSSSVDEEVFEEEEDAAFFEKLNINLSKLINAIPVMIFIKGTPTEPRCRYSRQLVNILRENGVRFGYFDVLRNDVVRKGMKQFSDWPTYPQIYINDEFLGGLDIIKESLEEDSDYFSKILI